MKDKETKGNLQDVFDWFPVREKEAEKQKDMVMASVAKQNFIIKRRKGLEDIPVFKGNYILQINGKIQVLTATAFNIMFEKTQGQSDGQTD